MKIIKKRLKEIEARYPRHLRAENAVYAAREFLIGRGFYVSDPQNVSSNGPDLVAIKDGFGCKVEVKAVTRDRGTWKVRKVTRKDDDYVVFVFPSGGVHVEHMSLHLGQCGKDGTRFLTALGKIYE